MTESHTYIDNTEYSNAIKEAIKGMLGLVLSSGENDINLDFDDLKTIMSHGGMAFVGSGEYEGKNSATEAIKLAIKDSTLDFNLLDKVTGILIHLKTHPDFSLIEIGEAMAVINEKANAEADIIWGTSASESIGEDYVKVTVFFAGFDKKAEVMNA